MARTKFTFEKRQRELARQQKQKDKAARRAEARQAKHEPERALQTEVFAAGDRSADRPANDETPGQVEETP